MDIRKSWLVAKPIAHRGLHNADLPENSLGAFENAIENGYSIELDVRTIDDGTVIVFHDNSLCRLTNSDGYACNLNINTLKDYNLLNTEYKIPTFEKVLEYVNGRVPILIETKNEGKVGELESKVVEMLKNYKGDIAVQSFNPMSMGYFRENAPHILRGQLASYFTKSEVSGGFKRYFLKRLKLNNISVPDFISYNAEYLPNKYVTRTKLPVLAWTIRSNADMERVLPHCDNIIFEKFIPEITK